MLRTQLALALVGLSMVYGCNNSSTPTPTAENSKPGNATVKPVEPMGPVPEQSEPEDMDSVRGAEAFASLVKAAESNDADAWAKAEATLQQLGVQATAALAARLSDENPVARELAAMFLAQIGPDAVSAAEGLVKLLKDDSAFARVNAASALSTFEGYAEQVAPVLTELLGDADDNVRVTAATSLRNVGPVAAKAVAPLTRALKDANPQVRAAAAASLGEIGLPAARSLAALQQLEADTEEVVVTAASEAIRLINESSDKATLAVPASATE